MVNDINQTIEFLPYRSPELPVAARVADLLKRMTLEEKAAQMTCVWQQKATKLLDDSGSFRRRQGPRAFWSWSWAGAGRTAERCRRRPQRAANRRAHERHSEILHRAKPAGNPCDLSRRMSARPGGAGCHELFAADRLRGDLRSGPREAAFHDDGRRGSQPRHASGAHAGRRRCPRAALGPRRGNLRRGSVFGFAARASQPCKVFKATAPSATRSTSSPR